MLGSLAGVWQGVKTVACRRSQRIEQEQGPLKAMLSCYAKSLLAAELMLFPPLMLLLVNGLRIQNCNYLGGLQFFLMMPMLSMACAAALGTIVGVWTKNSRRGWIVGYAIVVFYVLWSVYRFLASPAVYLYDPFFGYFPGAIYDEALEIGKAFYYSRFLQGLWLISVMVGCAVWLHTSAFQMKRRFHQERIWLLVLGSLLLLISLSGNYVGGKLGIYTDVVSLERYLDYEKETAHFIIRYRDGKVSAQDIALLAQEAEICYQELHELLGIEPTWRSSTFSRWIGLDAHADRSLSKIPKIIVYVFGSEGDKQRWIGAANTYIAKPWRREIYIHLQKESWPYSVFKHELAHLFAGAAGDSFLHLSLQHGIPHPGMIEGFAVAADWPGETLSVHQTVKAMRQLGFEPSLASVLSLSFWTLPAEQAYTVAGSFCRYLLDRFGSAPVLKMYTDGGEIQNFPKIFGVTFEILASDWSHYIDTQPLEFKKRESERDRLRHPAIFHKVCAHEIAQSRKMAEESIAQGRLWEALAILSKVCDQDPEEPEHQLDRIEILWALQDLQGVKHAAEQLLEHPQRTSNIESRALARLADVAVVENQPEKALKYYEQARELPISENDARLLVAKILVLKEPVSGPVLLDVLVGAKHRLGCLTVDRTEGSDISLLTLACTQNPSFGFCHYLLGRRLFQNKAYVQSIQSLQKAILLGFPEPQFIWQATLMLGQAQLLVDQADLARDTFEKLLPLLAPSEPGKKILVERWIERSRRWNSVQNLTINPSP